MLKSVSVKPGFGQKDMLFLYVGKKWENKVDNKTGGILNNGKNKNFQKIHTGGIKNEEEITYGRSDCICCICNSLRKQCTVYRIGRDDLQNAMNNDASTITSIADIEAAYKAVLKNEDTKIENQANAAVEAVGIVGGTFNGTYTKLALTAPAEKPAITAADYVVSGDPVYADITFKTDYNYSQEKHAFAIPLAITVKVPAGVDGSKAVVFHFASSGLETIKPIYDSAANTLTFAVNELSTFAIAEAEPAANAGSCGGTDDAFGRYRDNLTSEIANAKDGTTVKITRDRNINALPNDIMKALYKKQTVALELEYTFQGKDYTVTIPAGKAEDNAIEWYGPLYLQMRYGK